MPKQIRLNKSYQTDPISVGWKEHYNDFKIKDSSSKSFVFVHNSRIEKVFVMITNHGREQRDPRT